MGPYDYDQYQFESAEVLEVRDEIYLEDGNTYEGQWIVGKDSK